MAETLTELRARDPQALRDLVDAYTEVLYCAALGLGFPPHDAQDLVQETFVAFLGAIERFEGRSQLKTYLFGILYNKGSELRRKQRREEATDDIEAVYDARFNDWNIWKLAALPKGPEDEALSAELKRWIELCSQGLSLEQRTAFYLKDVEGESTEEIQKVLATTANNVGVLLFRARNKLRECLEKRWLGGKPK